MFFYASGRVCVCVRGFLDLSVRADEVSGVFVFENGRVWLECLCLGMRFQNRSEVFNKVVCPLVLAVLRRKAKRGVSADLSELVK